MLSGRFNKVQPFILSAAIMGCLLGASMRAEAVVTVTPADAAHVDSPAFGPVAPGGLITDQYIGFGLRFSTITPTAIFRDGAVDAWGGVNNAGNVDLLSDVTAQLELPGGGTLAQTDFLSVEGGFIADPNNLELTAYDINGLLLGSTNAIGGIGPHGRNLMTLNIPGIHSFIVHTPGVGGVADTFGVDQISFDELTPADHGVVPEPATLSLLGLGLPGLLAARRRKKA